MELTKERALELHRKMWNRIADKIEAMERVQNIHKLKQEFVEGYMINEGICNNCFCCEYANMQCGLCPVEWGNEYIAYEIDCPCETWEVEETDDRNGLYGDCRIEYDNKYLRMKNNWKHQAELARRIANLPERKVEGEV